LLSFIGELFLDESDDFVELYMEIFGCECEEEKE
jgi:hypothetical protein